MAIRYSGDVEIRIRYESGQYHGSVRSPGFRGHGTLSVREVFGSLRVSALRPSSPEAYDRAAMAFLKEARQTAKAHRIVLHDSPDIRRTFQSPCPYR